MAPEDLYCAGLYSVLKHDAIWDLHGIWLMFLEQGLSIFTVDVARNLAELLDMASSSSPTRPPQRAVQQATVEKMCLNCHRIIL